MKRKCKKTNKAFALTLALALVMLFSLFPQLSLAAEASDFSTKEVLL